MTSESNEKFSISNTGDAMEIPKTNIAIDELMFSLYQRPLHPELFEIKAKRHLKTENYETIVWETGCSHMISVFVGDMCLSEVIANSKQLLPKRGLVERFKFKGQRNHKCTLSRGLSYMTDFQVERMSDNLYMKSKVDLEKFSKNRGLFVEYPESSSSGLTPFSYIDFEPRRNELHVHSFHAFPEQRTILKTQSLFDFH